MEYSSNIQSVVMRRIHTINLLKPLFTGMTLSILVLIASLWGIGREVWVAKVFQNMPSITNVQAVVTFYINAFLDTRHAFVQVLTILVLAAAIWFVYSGLKSLRIATSMGRYA